MLVRDPPGFLRPERRRNLKDISVERDGVCSVGDGELQLRDPIERLS